MLSSYHTSYFVPLAHVQAQPVLGMCKDRWQDAIRLTPGASGREAADFVGRLQSDSIWVVVLEKLRLGLG